MEYNAKEVWQEYSVNLEKKIPPHIKSHAKIHEKVLTFTGQGARVLEAGCGSGVDSSYLSLRGRAAVGLDASIYALQVAKKVNLHLGGEVALTLGSLSHLPFKKQSFDLVYSSGVIHYFEDLTSLLDEQRRILKDGGYLIIDVPYTFSLFTVEKRARKLFGKWPWGKETQYSIKKLEKLLESHDFEIIESYSWGLDSVSNLLFNFSATRLGRGIPSNLQKFYDIFAAPLRSLIESKFPVNVGMVGRKL